MPVNKEFSTVKGVDMAILEGEYCSGRHTVRDLARDFGLDDSTIREYAEKYKWVKDLAPGVKKRTKQVIARSEAKALGIEIPKPRSIPRASAGEPAFDEDEFIEVTAQRHARIIGKSQKRIAKLQGIVESMFEELAMQSMSEEDIRNLAELMALTEGQEGEVDAAKTAKRIASLKKTLHLGERADTTIKLANTLKVLIGLERQAHGIADNANGDADGAGENKKVELSPNDIARRVAFVLTNAARKPEIK